MNRIIKIAVFFALASALWAQNPHGEDFQINCAACHSPEGWEIASQYWGEIELSDSLVSPVSGKPLPQDSILFHHNRTPFALEGQHASTDCRSCHETLVFSEASSDCISCHTDVHELTLGTDCARCHDSQNWLVDNIDDLHVQNGFPLLGAHAVTNCYDCHSSETSLRFEPIGNDCINCHLDEYQATTNPDHEEAGFSTTCVDCHDVTQFDWTTETVDHSFFPLTGGHEISDCAQCHTGGDFSNTPTDCFACHQSDFQLTEDPDHETADFATDCASCHTTDPGWMPAEFLAHDDLHFPIYSGGHEGTWTSCAECHSDAGNYAVFTCVACHENPETDEVHEDVVGYNYENTACLACHPTGDSDGSFDHNETNFPLTGAHLNVDCILCHADGYVGTPTDCAACHSTDFAGTQNPDHEQLGLSNECAMCHTTDPEWMPAEFANHDDYYALNGAHAAIANDCAACHNGDYVNTPNTCFGCHSEEYEQTSNPDHVAAQFGTDCASCHSESEWVPSTFDHDAQHFPIYSGAHNGTWSECTDCHTNLDNYAEVSCVVCHLNPETEDAHVDVGGYVYENTACLACHPTGDADNVFDHNNTAFPLTGAHTTTECIDCHSAGYTGTPTECAACHTEDFNQTSNPNHVALSLPTDCASCHTTDPGWTPASFDIHDNYYVLEGAHASIANDCAACHNGDYINTPNTCNGCHSDDYAAATDPNHEEMQLPVSCEDCHTQFEWTPSTFDHDLHYPFTGAHQAIANDCNACHMGDYENTPGDCAGCHTEDYNASLNPNHSALAIPTDCAGCHTTEPGWSPASFDIHNDYYVLNGAHAAIANDCATCHNGDYNNTPNTCMGCHSEDYNQTSDPDHQAAMFSADCASCHDETAWVPSTFDHDAQYFPIYSGEHEGEWSQCTDCHTNPSNYGQVSCTICHINPETDDAHTTVNGYTYNDVSCLTCHPTGSADDNFDHSNTNFPLTGAHTTVQCTDCHVSVYAGTPTDCVACHMQEFNQSVNPDHPALGIPMDCASCHTTDPGWMPASFDIHDNYYVLEGAHAGIANDCASCHNGDYNNTPNTCNGCHADDYAQATDPDHSANQFPVSCEDCHSQISWTPSTFDHDQYYPFTGAHTAIANDCAACHMGDYDNTPNTCAGCHTDDFNASTNPNHTALGIPTDCAACHTTDPGWMPASFDIHDNYYALEGAHAAIANECATCHNGDYNNTPNTCFGCHATEYNTTSDPDHLANQFPTDCAECHNVTSWVPSTFDHDQYYVFNGAHVAIANDCAACHIGGDYDNTPNTCNGCHSDDYSNTTDPDHAANQFPVSCADCHTEFGWEPSTFDHDQYYTFNGAHVAIANDCFACHMGDYDNTPTTCNGCHSDDYSNTTDPDHASNQFPVSCQDCHTEFGWVPSTFDHDQYYTFNGAHIAIADDCFACHMGDYDNTPTTCNGCHSDDYNNTTDPDHAFNQFPVTCEDCHNETAWIPSSFDHDAYYPLTGAHLPIENDCNACHMGDYDNTPNTCAGCHTNDYNASVNPDHQSLGIPTDCAMCHTTDPDWMPASFDIHDNYYVLEGAHAAIANDCAACHNGDYNNTPNTCFGCHQSDYNQTTNPDHAASGFPTTCEDCHNESAWIPAFFDHDIFYPLNGAHAVIENECSLCHIGGNYSNTPNTCNGCHNDDYAQTTDPDHQANQFPVTCEDCHNETAWVPSTFDHDAYYPLTGAHIPIENDCNLCHMGDYDNTPNTCDGCHTPDYNASNNPDHQSLSIPTDCAMCHTTSPDWMPADFPIHDNYWPLNGAHAAIANDCAACHNGDYNNTPNNCFGCHQDDYNQTTNPDHASAGFPTTCDDCHNESDWVPATFDHDAMYFPIYDGRHEGEWNDCVDCHIGGNFASFSCVDCHEHDDPVDLADEHDDVSGYIYSSPACFSCHPDGED